MSGACLEHIWYLGLPQDRDQDIARQRDKSRKPCLMASAFDALDMLASVTALEVVDCLVRYLQDPPPPEDAIPVGRRRRRDPPEASAQAGEEPLEAGLHHAEAGPPSAADGGDRQ